MQSKSSHSLPLSPSLTSPSAFSLSQHQGLFQGLASLNLETHGSSHQVAEVLELQLQHQSSNKYSGLISFRVDWFDFFAIQGTLKSLLQHQSLKASVFQCCLFYSPILTVNDIHCLKCVGNNFKHFAQVTIQLGLIYSYSLEWLCWAKSLQSCLTLQP